MLEKIPQPGAYFDSALRVVQHLADRYGYALDKDEEYCTICQRVTDSDFENVPLTGKEVAEIEQQIFQLIDWLAD